MRQGQKDDGKESKEKDLEGEEGDDEEEKEMLQDELFDPLVDDPNILFGVGDAQSLQTLIDEQDDLLEAYQANNKEIVANEREQRLKLEK